jgi:GNAT superfamily N-acetyltransferase
VVDLVGRADLFQDVRWINLPRHDPGPGYVRSEDWDLLWTTGPVPPQPGADRVVPIHDDAAIAALLDVAFPDAGVRPGSPHVLGWYGIWVGGSLVACAADRSTSSPGIGPVGLIGGVAVHPEHRRTGLGAAVTGELARRLQQTHEMVALGVDANNGTAIRVYERLGFAGRHRITSVRPSTVD